MAKEQQHHDLIIHTHLGDDALILENLVVEEGLSRLYNIELEFLANERLDDMEGLIGDPVSVGIAIDGSADSERRWLHGHFQRLRELGKPLHNSEAQRYAASVVPSAWSATQRINCRIFQDKTVAEIAATVLEEHGVNVEKSLNADAFKTPYCVQYNESDWDFVSRILACHGLHFFFRHESDNHQFVITDNAESYSKALEEKVRFCSRHTGEPHIRAWYVQKEATSNEATERGFDFTRPRTTIQNHSKQPVPGSQFGPREQYRDRGESIALIENQPLAEKHLEAYSRKTHHYVAVSNCRSFGAGLTFAFSEHEDKIPEHNEFVITAATLTMTSPVNTEGGEEAADIKYENRVVCLPTDTLFRPPAKKAPVIPGLQTATVTTSDGEDLHVDRHGRVKVQFHWDREGEHDARTSCWIRVAQAWAGAGYGAQFLPREGQEVLVEFINGDPDQPIITGSVHNSDNPMPYDPENQRSSGIRSRSTKEGGDDHYSEIRFDDTKGEEKLVLHAEHDHELTVENDQKDDIGNDREAEIANDDRLTVHNDQDVTVDGSHTLSAGKDITIDAGQSITLKTGAAEISLDSSGNIEIKGTSVKIDGSNLTLNGAKIDIN